MKMDFDFDKFPSTDIRKSEKIEEILDRLQKSSAHSGNPKNDSINFSNFGPIDQNKSTDKSFTSEMFNKPKQSSVPISNQRPEVEYEEENSRDIQQITYLYSQEQSFKFDRSMSFDQESKDNSRFERLKGLLSKAKSNNLDAFYRNLEQAANENNQGNVVFENKNQFKEFTRNMRIEKREEQAKFQTVMEDRKATQKVKTKNAKVNLFGEQAFKKKETDVFILPMQYLQQKYGDDQDVDFFASNNNNDKFDQKPQDEYIQQKKANYIKEAEQFFDEGDKFNQAKGSSSKRPLQTIREQRVTILDVSTEQKKFKQLIHNYNSMKGNYNTLMQQLKQTSTSQFQLMEEMQKIKQDYNTQQSRHKESRMSNTDEKKIKKEEKDKIKQIKEQQLASIKLEIHQIKNTTTEKDMAYVTINDKIQQLEQLVRVALQQIQDEKQHNFTPQVISYFNNPQETQQQQQQYQQYQHRRTPTPQSDRQVSEHVNLSQSVSGVFEADFQQLETEQHLASTGELKREKQSRFRQQKQHEPISAKQSKQQSRIASNMHSYEGSVRRDGPYIERNINKEPLNFVDEFSSPLQLDLSMDYNNVNNSNSESQEMYEIPFNPPDGALEYLPLQLDQTETKNLRSILTQKSSILFQSFEFLITVRYTMQEDETYPIVGSLRLANKCAIDLLDVFVLVYGPQGQNVEVTPAKIFQERLKYNSNVFFEVRLDKVCIKDNGFNVQVCYKTDSITKKKINFKALLPVIQMIRPQFCYEQNFLDAWHSFRNEVYIRPKKLNFKHIRNHEDLKLVLPLIHISEQDPNTFSYGLMFRYPKSQIMFMLKISCYINGKASVHLRADKNGDQPLKEELLNIINFLFLK